MGLCRRAIVVSWAVSCLACGPSLVGDDGAGTDGSDDDPSSSDDASASVTVATMATTATTATVTGPDNTGTDATVSASVSATASDSITVSATDPTFTATDTATATVATMTTDPTDPSDTSGDAPNGSPCGDDAECESSHCFDSPLGSICGECELDSDCPGGGCTPPNVFVDPPTGSFCNAGDYADGCMSDDACEPSLQCALVVDIPGISMVSTCSECEVDGDCDGGLVCAPDIAVIGNLTGVKRCVVEASLVNGQSCDFATSGDVSCASGHCAIADVMGLVLFGVCSECEADDECAGQVCEPPLVDLIEGITPGVCSM